MVALIIQLVSHVPGKRDMRELVSKSLGRGIRVGGESGAMSGLLSVEEAASSFSGELNIRWRAGCPVG
jgi:hypothetical protein